uniref:DNA-directed RNA polymerase n=1 Tax=Ulva compressa TaxID=63659 RepID=A0A678ZHQ3_ULVCO|nr:hypothetical protein [Ulva compressa]
MGMLNLDIGLCDLTNVIGNSENSENCEKLNKKKDIYEFFTKELLQQLSKPLPFQLNKDKELNKFSEDYLTQNLDRKLLKMIVMPLIYGKTSYGFAEDLENFFAKNHLYPANSALLKLANLIITKLKTHPHLMQSNSLMMCLQSFGKIMFNLEKVAIVGPYNVSNTHYIQLETAQISPLAKGQQCFAGQKQRQVSMLIKRKAVLVFAFEVQRLSAKQGKSKGKGKRHIVLSIA